MFVIAKDLPSPPYAPHRPLPFGAPSLLVPAPRGPVGASDLFPFSAQSSLWGQQAALCSTRGARGRGIALLFWTEKLRGGHGEGEKAQPGSWMSRQGAERPHLPEGQGDSRGIPKSSLRRLRRLNRSTAGTSQVGVRQAQRGAGGQGRTQPSQGSLLGGVSPHFRALGDATAVSTFITDIAVCTALSGLVDPKVKFTDSGLGPQSGLELWLHRHPQHSSSIHQAGGTAVVAVTVYPLHPPG